MNWSAPKVVICAVDASGTAQAEALAQQFSLDMVDALPTEHDASLWTLLLSSDGLTLSRPDGLSTSIDFLRGKATQRTQESDFKSQPLARALGLKQLRKRNANATPTIIDATAGFGSDGWMMASLSCHVRLIEASGVLSAMLTHALEAARGAHDSIGTVQNLTVVNTDSINYLTSDETDSANIIYLDPMYPQTRSNALVKKGMQLLHELIGPDDNRPQLLTAALGKATYRVVVKRPRGAPQLPGSDQWSGQITDVQSAHTRFDIYHINNV